MRRPAGVTLIAVLLVVAAVLAAMIGLGVLLARGDAAFLRQSQLAAGVWLAVGLAALLLAAVDLLVARALLRGRGWARGASVVLALLHLVGGGFGMLTFGGNLQWSSILTVAVALMALGVVWSNRSAASAASGPPGPD